MSIQNTGPVHNSKNVNTGFNYNRLKFNTSSGGSSHSISSSEGKPSPLSNSLNQTKNAVTDAKVYVRIVDEPCDGYEKFKTIMITFEVEDGIQTVS